jgi:predicted alpha-1,2-mannosidase
MYLGFDGEVHLWPNASSSNNNSHISSHYYSDMSLWDVHRSQIPLLSLLGTEGVAVDTVRSLIDMHARSGIFPRWPLASVATGCMIGSHGSVVVADIAEKHAILCQRKNKDDAEGEQQIDWPFDLDSAYEAMRAIATQPQPCCGRIEVENYTRLGFVPLDREPTAASLTLSYAFDDSAIARVAALLGRDEDADTFGNASNNYRHLWSREHQLMCARFENGTQVCPNKIESAVPFPLAGLQAVQYIEGDAWQWLWFVPHDPDGLIALFPSSAAFVERLEIFLRRTAEGPWAVNGPADILPAPFYWAGNEPDLLAPWLFAYGGRSDLTQQWSRWIMANKYSAKADGIPGNDDFGTMSAWYVFAALGLYPRAGSSEYVLGAPIFGLSTIRHPDGTATRIVAHNASAAATRVARVEVNGVALNVEEGMLLVETAELVGGLLEFWMVED